MHCTTKKINTSLPHCSAKLRREGKEGAIPGVFCSSQWLAGGSEKDFLKANKVKRLL